MGGHAEALHVPLIVPQQQNDGVPDENRNHPESSLSSSIPCSFSVCIANARAEKWNPFIHSAPVLYSRRLRFAPLLSQCRFVAAPMVGISDLPFRLLCRQYGATVCYSEMMDADLLLSSPSYRQRLVHSCSDDRPLVLQLAASSPTVLLQAALSVQSSCDAVCLNLGCPQRTARRRGYGAFLLDDNREQRLRLLDIVHTATSCPALLVPLFVKIRVLESRAATIALCLQLAMAGASLIAVHARCRGRVEQRRDGAADLSAVRDIAAAVAASCLPVHILSNGNVRQSSDIACNLAYTRADGIMVAEQLAADPSLFSSCLSPSPSPLLLARQYLQYVQQCGCESVWSAQELWHRVLGHLMRMAGAELRYFQTDGDVRGPCGLQELETIVAEAEKRQQQERSGQWQRPETAEAGLQQLREQRQRTVESVRMLLWKRERLPQLSADELQLNSKQRYRKRRRAEQLQCKAQAVVDEHRDDDSV
jgi:tRNA-dihydrouridine synthase 1